jgi:hypothetical protein
VPFLHTNGNHEIEWLADEPTGGFFFTSYNHRYPVPMTKEGEMPSALKTHYSPPIEQP